MAPRRTNQAATDQPTNVWEELRKTLLAMQENIQATIHNSMRELAESVYLQQRDRRRQPSEDGTTEADDTPSAEEVQHRGNRFDRTNMFPRLQNLRQGSRSVDDYAEEFSLLLSKEILDIEVQLVSRFIGGLRPQLRNAMSQFYPLTVAEAHRRAVAVVPEDASSQVDVRRLVSLCTFLIWYCLFFKLKHNLPLWSLVTYISNILYLIHF